MSPIHEVHEALRVLCSREAAERLAFRLRAEEIACSIEAPARPLRQLPPGRWTVTVPASLLERAAEVAQEPDPRLPGAESCE